jgi:hypothetical protein
MHVQVLAWHCCAVASAAAAAQAGTTWHTLPPTPAEPISGIRVQGPCHFRTLALHCCAIASAAAVRGPTPTNDPGFWVEGV